MSRVFSETTAREEQSSMGEEASRLALEWVWPETRTDSLEGARMALGRDPAAAIRLDGSGVSRMHAELYRQGPLYVIRDLGSTNGTWLGGKRVQYAPVGPGTVLRLGDWVAVFATRPSSAQPFAELAPGLFGGHEMADLLAPLRRAASSNLPILLVGETGTGKERVARAAHHFSARGGPFIAINCAALPEHLAEAELFGYRKGAFTGAERASLGCFRAAHGGTLFLDEMPELSHGLQAKLLRVLEDGVVQGLGEPLGAKVDVRIVSASQQPLRGLVAQGRLRQDLAARLAGLDVRLPKLAARRADIASLFLQLLRHQCGGRIPSVEARLVEALSLHDWPENVRELDLLTRRLVAVHGHEGQLRRQHLPEELRSLNEGCADAGASRRPVARREHDLSRIKEELAANGGKVKTAAVALGISRQRVYRLLNGEASRNVGGRSDDSRG